MMKQRDVLNNVAYPAATGVLVAAATWVALNLSVDFWTTASRDTDLLPRATLTFLPVGLAIAITTITPKGTGLVAAIILASPLVPYLIDGSTWLPEFVPGNPLLMFSESASWTAIWAMIAIDIFRIARSHLSYDNLSNN